MARTGSINGRIEAMSVSANPRTAGSAEVGQLRTLYRLLAALIQAKALEDVYDAALASLLDATEADRAAILLFDDDGVVRFKASRGLSAEYQTAVTGHSPWARGALGAKPVMVSDVRIDENLAVYRDVLAREGIRALVLIPLALDAGVFGKFMLYYAEPHECGEDELQIAQAIAAHVGLATQHKRAELARVASEQRLQAILNNSASVIFLKDLEGRYRLINRRWEELFHKPQEDVLGRTDYDLFAAATADEFRANDRAVLAAGKPLAIEEYVQHDDGLHTYIVMKFTMEGSEGMATAVCVIATDITSQKRLEAASQRLAALVESSDDAIVGKDLNGIITSWNKGAESIFGYSAAEVIGQPVSILAVPGHEDEMPRILNKIGHAQRVEHYDTRRRRKNGEIIDVALTVSPVRDAAGRIIGASKIARDISERKHAEMERAQLLSREQQARRTAELLYRIGPRLTAQLDIDKLAQEITDIATALVGAEFGALYHNVVNDKGESYMLYTLSGVTADALAAFPMPCNTDLFASTFRDEAVVRCDDVTQDPRYGAKAPQQGMPAGQLPVRSYLAAPVIARSGEMLGGLFFGHSAPGKFTAAHETIVAGIAAQAAVAMDNARLFEQSQWVQAELKRSNEQLRRANRDLEVFAYSASHDLQEPLRTIAISAQLIEHSCGHELHGDDAAFLANILTAARRMGALIDDLLAYTRAARYEEGAVPRVEAERVLAEVLESLRGQIEAAGAIVTSGKLPAVAMHESRLAQLFQNLISNAIKYRSKEEPRVHVSADQRDGWCVFSVVDNGIGIEPQFAEQIFGLFKRLHGRDEYPGSGIGLAICQRVVEQYGGRIWLEQSTPERGSTLLLLHPLARLRAAGKRAMNRPIHVRSWWSRIILRTCSFSGGYWRNAA